MWNKFPALREASTKRMASNVAWVSVDSQTILSIHNNVITRNPRISLSRPTSNQWHLHIQRAKEADRGWYMCQINTDPMVHRSGYLEVVVPPRILNKDDETDLVVREGENLTLTCDAVGHPRPHIVWRREDGEDVMVEGKKVPPMFWIPSQLEGAYVGQDITLECHSEAFPKSINYWIKEDGAMLISGDKYESLIVDSGYKVYMKLRIRNVSKEDFMEYKCVAKNSLGGSDGSITLYEVNPPTTTTTQTTTVVTWAPTTTTQRLKQRQKDKRKERKYGQKRREHEANGGGQEEFFHPNDLDEDGEIESKGNEGFFDKFGFDRSASSSSSGIFRISLTRGYSHYAYLLTPLATFWLTGIYTLTHSRSRHLPL
eukprot:snap_masked-scaffold506_size152672-processed-gene-0.3 protein:Tk07580 transcript:snap_masked-scaffold506_size152672-processed-gene-0.3-mRNA-1 annotation:"PREDICTED: uncharacterized protein LOC102656402"